MKNEEFYSGGKSGVIFQRLLFSLCFFHGVVEERSHYGPVGWNMRYGMFKSNLNQHKETDTVVLYCGIVVNNTLKLFDTLGLNIP